MATGTNPERLVETLYGAIRGLVRNDGRDLSARQLGVFLTCYLEGEPQTVRGLAARLNISKPAITRAIDRLEGAGLARRKVDPRDHRSVLIVHTREGQAFLRELKRHTQRRDDIRQE